MTPTEPTDEQVEQFIEQHPGGCTLDDIAAVLGVTRTRAQQIVTEATAKLIKALRARGVHAVGDVLDHRQYGHNSRDQLFG